MQILKIRFPFVIGSVLFRVNQEYEICKTTTKLTGCGCNGTAKVSVLYYDIIRDGNHYEVKHDYGTVHEKPAVTNSVSPEEYRNNRATAKPGEDFNAIRTNLNADAIAAKANINPM